MGAMDKITLRRFDPRDAPWLVACHGAHYARDEGFDDSFAPLVADILRGFIADHDPTREAGWIAEQAGWRLGSVFCVRRDEDTAQLRLFLLVPQARGKGLGRRLLRVCMGFARARGYRRMRLWTHESHRAACALYRRAGWRLMRSQPVRAFGRDLVEQSWEFNFH